jgi:hypothetical protein
MVLVAASFLISTKAQYTGTNLAPIPNASFWSYPTSGGWSIGNPWTGNGYASANYYLYPITKGGQTSIQLDSDPAINTEPWGESAELDGPYVSIAPGDVVYFSAQLWVGTSTVGDTNKWDGAIIGCDIQNNNERVCQIDNDVDGVVRPDYISGDNTAPYSGGYDTAGVQTVNFGSGAFVTLSFSFTVAASYQADGYLGYSTGSYAPTSFAPWIVLHTANPTTEMANLWIANTVIYVNPSGTSTPSPAPTPTPTPIVTPTPSPTPTPTPIGQTPSPSPTPTPTPTATPTPPSGNYANLPTQTPYFSNSLGGGFSWNMFVMVIVMGFGAAMVFRVVQSKKVVSDLVGILLVAGTIGIIALWLLIGGI